MWPRDRGRGGGQAVGFFLYQKIDGTSCFKYRALWYFLAFVRTSTTFKPSARPSSEELPCLMEVLWQLLNHHWRLLLPASSVVLLPNNFYSNEIRKNITQKEIRELQPRWRPVQSLVLHFSPPLSTYISISDAYYCTLFPHFSSDDLY